MLSLRKRINGMRLVFATGNKGKLREAREILGPGFEILSQAEAGIAAEAEENGSTLEENSMLKAEFVHARTGSDCFADVSGLEVEALGGAPGVLSARYAASLPGSGALPHDARANMRRLLDELSALGPGVSRKARFRTVITLCVDGEYHVFEGEVSGRIGTAESGGGGFGYDPVFIPDGFGGRTMAEISEEEKNSVSHRGMALRRMACFLARYKSCLHDADDRPDTMTD